MELVINTKTALALGIEVPLPLLIRADELLECRREEERRGAGWCWYLDRNGRIRVDVAARNFPGEPMAEQIELS